MTAIYNIPTHGGEGHTTYEESPMCQTCLLSFVGGDEDKLVAWWVRDTNEPCINEDKPTCKDYDADRRLRESGAYTINRGGCQVRKRRKGPPCKL